MIKESDFVIKWTNKKNEYGLTDSGEVYFRSLNSLTKLWSRDSQPEKSISRSFFKNLSEELARLKSFEEADQELKSTLSEVLSVRYSNNG